MKRNQTVKGKDYPLSTNSKLASLDFAKATSWASQIYAPLKRYERRLAERPVFQSLSRLLVKVYTTDYTNALGTKKLFAGEVDMLTKWRLSPYSQWNIRMGVDINLTMEPHTGKAVLTLPRFVLPANRFTDRARQMAMRFYVYVLDEDKEAMQIEITDDLQLYFDNFYDEVKAEFEFSPINNGVVLLLGVSQLHLVATNYRDVFSSFDRRYYQANLIQALAIKNGKLFTYHKKTVEVTKEMEVKKVAWQQK